MGKIEKIYCKELEKLKLCLIIKNNYYAGITLDWK
jgi:hypothetical protein